MRRGPSTSANSVLVGASIVAAIIVGVFLTYNANRGLPFVSTFRLVADVPDAAELVAGSEVRIGGFRVGQVRSIEAMPPRGDDPPFARLELALDASVTGIPRDTVVRIRPRSVLGAKYVELTPGESPREVTDGGRLPLSNARATPEIDETFNVFDPDTREALQSTIRSFGDATAGRGGDINLAVREIARSMPALQRTVDTLASERADLRGFVDGAATLSGALAPVAPALGDLTGGAARTLAALDAAGPSLERTLAGLPPAEETGTRALRAVAPVLRDITELAEGLRPGTRRLPAAAERIAEALDASTPVLERTGELTAPLDRVLATLGRVARDPAAPGSLRKLTAVVDTLRPTVEHLLPAQVVCNFGGVWSRNLGSVVSEGDPAGSWISLIPVFRTEQVLHAAVPDPDLHYTGLADMNAHECESGNEPYSPGQVIGNPAGRQPARTDETAPPPGALDRAREAGLMDPVEGSRG